MYKFNKWANLGLCVTLVSSLMPRVDVRSAEPPSVVINELMWMGSSASALDEWIELRNLTDQAVDLSNWLITKKTSGAETPMLVLPAGASIPARGFFLIANYAADSASSRLGVQADWVDSDVSLVNSALQIKLYDAVSLLVDVADDGSGAPVKGKYTSGSVWQSMERTAAASDGTLASSWRTASTSVNFDSADIELGTPRAPNGNSAPVAEAGPDLRRRLMKPFSLMRLTRLIRMETPWYSPGISETERAAAARRQLTCIKKPAPSQRQ